MTHATAIAAKVVPRVIAPLGAAGSIPTTPCAGVPTDGAVTSSTSLGAGVTGDGVVGDGVTGDGVVGDGLTGDGVVGDGVVGAGVTGAGVIGAGVTGAIVGSDETVGLGVAIIFLMGEEVGEEVTSSTGTVVPIDIISVGGIDGIPEGILIMDITSPFLGLSSFFRLRSRRRISSVV